MSVTLSSELAPRIGEYERTSTVALNAGLSPTLSQSLRNLERLTGEKGFNRSLLVMQGYGGLLTVPQAISRAVGTDLNRDRPEELSGASLWVIWWG